jgi:hypothetical protein
LVGTQSIYCCFHDQIAFVPAGYEKPMEDQIMSFNEGLPSRFPLLFKFPDYTDQQLHDILMGQLESGKPAFTLEEAKYARIAAKRCAGLSAAGSYIETSLTALYIQALITRSLLVTYIQLMVPVLQSSDAI